MSSMDAGNNTRAAWLIPLKKKLLYGIAAIMAVSFGAAMVFTVAYLRSSLLQDSAQKTRELSETISGSLGNLMIQRTPETIQSTIARLTDHNSTIVKAFILDKAGRVAYSSAPSEIGLSIDRHEEPSCRTCHHENGTPPLSNTTVTKYGGAEIHRNISVILNEKECFACHPPSDRIIGKLVIDRSLQNTNALIRSVEYIVIATSLACFGFILFFVMTVLSRGLDRYIGEVESQHAELSILYMLVERVSKTLDVDELREIVVKLLMQTFGAEGADIIVPKASGFSAYSHDPKKDKLVRIRIREVDPLMPALRDWLEGRPEVKLLSDDRREIHLPIAKGRERYAFIVLRSDGFDPDKLELLRAMGSHIAVAFENAWLYHIAITDDLTELYTQRHFKLSISQRFEEFELYGEKTSLLMLDIDDFKKINDSLGHVAGDAVLRELSTVIKDALRDDDTAYRYGGEEFTVILPETDLSGADNVGERIRTRVEAHDFLRNTHNIRLTVSIGAASCPESAVNAKDLILAADKAMYAAKKSGKNRTIPFSYSLNQ